MCAGQGGGGVGCCVVAVSVIGQDITRSIGFSGTTTNERQSSYPDARCEVWGKAREEDEEEPFVGSRGRRLERIAR